MWADFEVSADNSSASTEDEYVNWRVAVIIYEKYLKMNKCSYEHIM